MKGLLKLIPVALAVVALVSCADDDFFGSKSGKTDTSKIVATINSSNVTRVAMGVDANGDRGIVFSDDDALNVYTTSSTDVAHYTLTGGENTEKAVFEYDEDNSTMDEPNLTSGEDYIAVVENVGSDIIGVAASANGPRLIMSIPEEYDNIVTVDGVTWASGAKQGTGYKMPLPLWGDVTEEDGKLAVAFKYLTGFMKIKVINMRAGAQSLQITSDAKHPLSGYFEAYLSGDDAVLAPNKAYTTSNTITVSLENAINAYEGVDTTFYVPMIAQTYDELSVDVLDADGNFLENLYTSDKKITVKKGKGVNLTRAMTVTEGATNGADISSKLFELTSKNAGMPVRMELINPVSDDETIIIDKNATSDITLVFFKAIPNNLKIVEGTKQSVDANGNVTWSTEKTNELSNPQAAKRTVTIVYADDVINDDDMYLYLPNSEVVLAGSGEGDPAIDYTGKITTLCSLDGGFTIDESASVKTVGSDAYTNINGPITVNGITNYVMQYGEGDVTINNLDDKVQAIYMGQASKKVTGNLTINGYRSDATTFKFNNAIVNKIVSYSTGAFTASNIDKGQQANAWTFNCVSESPITITNDKNISKFLLLEVKAQNNLVLNNAIVTTYDYTAAKKATVTATGRSAIGAITGDIDDMLSVSSTWDGNTNVIPVTSTEKRYYNGSDFDKVHAIPYVDVITGTEIHTAFQLACLQNATAAIGATGDGNRMEIKATTVIDLNNQNWAGITQPLFLEGDANNNEVALGKVATIKNLKNVTAPADYKVASVNKPRGFVSNVAGDVELLDLNFETVDFENGSATGALIGVITGDAELYNITLSGVTVKGLGNWGVGGVIGSIGGDADIDALTVDVTEASAASFTKADGDKKPVAGSYVGGLIGINNGDATIETTSVEAAAIKGIWYLGGMIGAVLDGTSATFGGGNNTDYTSVNVASFALADGAASWVTTANKENWGSVNTYVGYVEGTAGIDIKKYCKHGAVVSSVSAKEALNFKKNNSATSEADVNSNTLFFWSGNAWVGIVDDGATIKFPNASNVEGTRTKGTDYHVFKLTPYYSAETYKDWDQ